MSDIVLYSVDYCPYCKKAEELLNTKGIHYRKIDITFNEDEYRERLGDYYHIQGKVTLPQIVVNNNRIGGFDELEKLEATGELDKIFEE